MQLAAETGLYVYGMLSAIGAEEDSIHFTNNEEGEEWTGIHFYQPEEEYNFEYCTIRNAYNGLVTRWHIYLNVIHCDINCTYIAFGTLDPNENDHVGNRYHFEDSIIIGSRITTLSRSSVIGINCYFNTGGYDDESWGFTNLGSVVLTDCDFYGTLGGTLSGAYRNCNIYSPNELPVNVYIVGGGALIQDCYVEGRVEVINNRTDIVGNEISGKLNIQSYTGLISDNVIGKMKIRYNSGPISITNCIIDENVAIYDGPEVEMYDCYLLGNVDPWINTLYLIGLDIRETPVHFIHHNLILGRVGFAGDYLDVVVANNTIIAESLDDPLFATTLQEGTIQITNNVMICEGENDGLYYPMLEPGLNAIIKYNLMHGFDQFLFSGPLVEDAELDESNLFDVNPLLVSLDPLDPRPMPDSPCVDAGDPDSPLDPDSTRADIGMFYYHHAVSVPDSSIVELYVVRIFWTH